ncbi:MAG TPA: hypothetical protein VFQ20_12795 [Burkholderiaceae bacterium]|nr:hypothetical protein [Burkholderiaceae bacterium]
MSLPKSVTYTLVGMVGFLLSGIPFIAPAYDVRIPSPWAEVCALALFVWPPAFIAAVVHRIREARQSRGRPPPAA